MGVGTIRVQHHTCAGSGSPHFAHFADTLDPSGWLPVTALRRFVYERSHTVGVILPYDASCRAVH